MGALISEGLVQVSLDARDVFWAAVAASIQDYSIGQYSSVVVGSFRIARCRRGGGEFCLGIERSP